MEPNQFETFFQDEARMFLLASIRIALSEDGPDLTSTGIFAPEDTAQAQIVAKQSTIVAGLPILPLVLEFGDGTCRIHLNVDDGDRVSPGTLVAVMQGPAAKLLKAERVMLNFLCHLSGIAELTSRYVESLRGTKTKLLDTRKTLPGLRYPEKYAVLCGGGHNHRKNLVEMCMLKDNHIDRAGGITQAVAQLRSAHSPCPPVEVECRTRTEVEEAVTCDVQRIMLDNMHTEEIRECLDLIPDKIETEVSGGVNLDTIHDLAQLGPDFISVGRLTHSAPASDFSMRIEPL
ncbi:nicotinate-nucleotide pyrophosphorylase [carboxylating] [Paucidesulfovibrio gracilis DSM 16080]|uniref:Probable nicotinate-nucleotide pyrophosphorylase [carboxylating] n=1 Tax=Paucidesulfovibrio gracilis DSM 16080 TaxID=1121449 RepID=A0A1T4WVP4_9BACT|nr:carboxylating nicotinate-nucleotide diphosphorylase [Paucidesulfovibrio gracilis]SKA80928.1 nicotinate-nucleotide pyrophosphorylase [carboxylating] [Paucidesulfovibrio gracilis DSM 16080]